MIDPASRAAALRAAAEKEIKAQFIAAVLSMQSALGNLSEVARLLESGAFERVLRLLDRAALRLGTTWAQVFNDAATSTAALLTSKLKNVEATYDQASFTATEIVRQNRARLITNFINEQARASRGAASAAAMRGDDARSQAKAFKDSIGLTEYQQRSLDVYRRSLLQAGRSKQQADRLVEEYRKRLLAARATAVAAVEAQRAVHEGIEEAYRQAILDGELEPNQVSASWKTMGDDKVRHSHRPMDGQTQPYGQPFVTGRGNRLRFPTDPNGPIEEIANCRCVLSHTINDG